jgi:hypothetical protein
VNGLGLKEQGVVDQMIAARQKTAKKEEDVLQDPAAVQGVDERTDDESHGKKASQGMKVDRPEKKIEREKNALFLLKIKIEE